MREQAHPRRHRGGALALVLGAVGLALGALTPAAGARPAYVATANEGTTVNTAAVFDTRSGQQLATPIPVARHPVDVAISPDGSRAYVVSLTPGALTTIDTRTNQVIGQPLTLGGETRGIAVSPDGTRIYVADEAGDDVVVIDATTMSVLGRIDLADGVAALGVSPDGARLFVGVDDPILGDVMVAIETATNQVIGAPLPFPGVAKGIGFTPDGATLYAVTDGEVVVAVDPRALAIRATVPVGDEPRALAVSPDGTRAFALVSDDNQMVAVDTATNQPAGSPVPIEPASRGIAIAEGRVFVTSLIAGNVSVFDARTTALLGTPIALGNKAEDIAVVPDQPPIAALAAPPARVRPGVPITFDASPSRDPDGAIATFVWAFGDGASATASTPTTNHTFAKPGTYTATLTLADEEGCSTALVYTGQTASCNGSALARVTRRIDVAYPGVRVRCPKRARPRGCRYALQVVARKPKRGGRKAKAQSAVARVKLKAGRGAIVSFKPKKAFAKRLASARTVLVRETKTVAGKRSVAFRKLKIVR